MKPGLVVGLSVVGLQACASAHVTPDVRDFRPQPAAQLLVSSFERFPLVAFSEPGHGAAGTKEFLSALVRQPAFAGTVNDIVVEFGNARYQDVVDRYTAGERVARDELKLAWENTTVATGVWTAPMYEAVLIDIRAFNSTLPPGQRIRVLLGDPPIDWNVVRGPADEDMNDWRDAHFAWVVEEQVMKRGRRALLWIGGAHLGRKVRFPNSLIHLLDERFPNQTFVVQAIDRQDAAPHVMSRLRPWPSFAAAPVRGTWFGGLDAADVGFRLSTGTVEQNIDAALFWASPPGVPDEGPRVDAGSPLAIELQRRRQLAETTGPFRGGGIRFEAERATIVAASDSALHTVLAELRRDPSLRLVVKAFIDARESGGLELSWRRARAVVDWLTSRGVTAERVVPKGCAATRALWVGDTEQERAANRRAELVRMSKVADCAPPASFHLRDLQ
jgi:outer membrane protein OmpA-like peptidoglycan-associated protein